MPETSDLCPTCSMINFEEYFEIKDNKRQYEPSDPQLPPHGLDCLGHWQDVFAREKSCAFCRLVQKSFAQKIIWNTPSGYMEILAEARGEDHLYIFSLVHASNPGTDSEGQSATGSERRPTATPLNYRIGIVAGTRDGPIANGYDPCHVQLAGTSSGRFARTDVYYGKIMDPSRVDLSQAAKWLEICRTKHGEECEVPDLDDKASSNPHPPGMLVIDVQEMRLCPAPTDFEYVALSYRWPASPFVLTRSVLDALSVPGALHTFMSKFPPIIQDTIACAIELKQRYLWIDALCVIQDDEAHKSVQIPRMDRIYMSAAVTIVAASKLDDIHIGLPGYRSGTRKAQQHLENVKGLDLMVPFQGASHAIDRTIWRTRAWTYQEEALSRRKLLFTDDQLYFICSCVAFCEDTISEDTPSNTGINRGSAIVYPKAIFEPSSNDQSTHLRDYMYSVAEYSRRAMTDPGDAISAFQGILSIFGRKMKTSFLAGLPERYLDAALLWVSQRSYRVRDTSRTKGIPVGFPTWSWAGWDSHISFLRAMDKIVVSEVEWYLVDSDSHVYGVSNGLPAGLESTPSTGFGIQDLRPLSNTPRSFLKSVRSRDGYVVQDRAWGQSQDLLCWTSVASFIVDGKELEWNELIASSDEKRLMISDTGGRFIGAIIMHIDLISQLSDRDRLFEFMLLSRCKISIGFEEESPHFDESVFQRRDWCYINIMLIERNADTARRLGIATIHEDAWAEANPKAMMIKLK